MRKRTLAAFRFWTESRLQAVQKKNASVQTALVIRSEKISIRSKNLLIRSNGLSHPLRKKLHLFERLPSSVQNKLATVRTAQFTVQKISRSVRTAWVIHSKNLSICLNGLNHQLGPSGKKQTWSAHLLEQLSICSEKIFTCLDGYSHPLEIPELSLKVPAKQSQYVNATYRNIVGRNMLRAFGHLVASCCDMLGVVGSSLKMVKFEPTTPNMSQHDATWWPNVHNMLRSFGWGLRIQWAIVFLLSAKYKGALVQIRVAQLVKCRRIPFFSEATTLWIVRSINILYSITFINLSNPRFPYHSIQFNLPIALSIKVITIVYIWSRWKNAPVAAKVIILSWNLSLLWTPQNEGSEMFWTVKLLFYCLVIWKEALCANLAPGDKWSEVVIWQSRIHIGCCVTYHNVL